MNTGMLWFDNDPKRALAEKGARSGMITLLLGCLAGLLLVVAVLVALA